MPTKLARGRRLGKYRLVKKLAEGGFGTVFSALDTVEGVHVALKVPRAELVTPQALAWFRKEVRLHAGLDHPNVLPLKNADLIDGHFVIAYPQGLESLGDRLRRRMGIETFLALADQMLAAVAHAHERGLIHCDLKPDNFILFPGGRIRLTDFGISRLGRRTVVGSGSGTLGYVAPEQAMGRPSFRSDVFSMGLILYEMLTGTVLEWPFRWPGPGADKLRRKVPATFAACLRRALEVEPGKRHRDARELHAAFVRLRPLIRRFASGRKRKRNGATSARDWTKVRFGQFRRQCGSSLALRHTCRRCEGPVAESMVACPWCSSKLRFKGLPTRFPARCPRCHRGRKLDWKFCAWCYGPKFARVADQSYSDRNYEGRCAQAACRGPLMPLMRYCPWCRTKVKKRARVAGLPHRCAGCDGPVEKTFWSHCPWCVRKLR